MQRRAVRRLTRRSLQLGAGRWLGCCDGIARAPLFRQLVGGEQQPSPSLAQAPLHKLGHQAKKMCSWAGLECGRSGFGLRHPWNASVFARTANRAGQYDPSAEVTVSPTLPAVEAGQGAYPRWHGSRATPRFARDARLTTRVQLEPAAIGLPRRQTATVPSSRRVLAGPRPVAVHPTASHVPVTSSAPPIRRWARAIALSTVPSASRGTPIRWASPKIDSRRRTAAEGFLGNRLTLLIRR